MTRRAGAALLCFGLAACQTVALDRAPSSPSAPWPMPAATRAMVTTALAASQAERAAAITIDRQRGYDLPALIDLAQRNNPSTRVAWEAARQAAAAVGAAESAYLPKVSALALGGYQRLSNKIDVPTLGSQSVTTNLYGVAPALAVEWLLFDFGGREAAVEAAKQLSLAANVQFNRAHQRVVFEVSHAYRAQLAAEQKTAAARLALTNARAIEAAAVARDGRGLGTKIEVAQARQQVAQFNLALTLAEGEAASARVALPATLGLPPTAALTLRDDGAVLPAPSDATLDQMLDEALANRPEIVASLARVRAAEADVNRAQALFRPKVGVIGNLTTIDNRFQVGSGPTLGTPLQANGVLVGVTVPLYTGGLDDHAVATARSQLDAARSGVAVTRDAAATEIAKAYEALRTGLAAYRAADALVAAARETADAARAAHRNGVGTVTDAIAAENGLLQAEQARADTRRDAFDAATALAFAAARL